MSALAAYPVIVLDGCDGTGKTTLAEALREQLGPLLHGRSRITQQAAVSLAQDVAQRGGTLVYLTGVPESIAARLRSRDGTTPPVYRIRAITDAFQAAFDLLAEAAPVITADTTATVLA